MTQDDEPKESIVLVEWDDTAVSVVTSTSLGFASERDALALPDNMYGRLAAESILVMKCSDPFVHKHSDIQMAYSLLSELGNMATASIRNCSFSLMDRNRYSTLSYEPQHATGAAVHLANLWIKLQGWLGVAGHPFHISVGSDEAKIEFRHLNSCDPAHAIGSMTHGIGVIVKTTVGCELIQIKAVMASTLRCLIERIHESAAAMGIDLANTIEIQLRMLGGGRVTYGHR